MEQTSRLQSLEAEQAVLGAMLIDPDAFGVAQEAGITAGHFSSTSHQLLFGALESLAGQGMPQDFLTVSETLQRTGKLADAGGESYLLDMVDNTPSAANTFAYARIVIERAVQRRWFYALSQARDKFLDYGCADPVAAAEVILSGLDSNTGMAGFASIRDVLKAEVARLDHKYHNPGLDGLQTGYHNIDFRLGGMQAGELVVVGARPGMGKTAFALNVMRQVALQKQAGSVLVYSLEMTAGSLVQRLLAAQGKIKKDLLRSAKVFDHDESCARLTTAMHTLMDVDIRICDKPGLTVREIRTMALAEKRRRGVRLAVVDYLGLVEYEGDNKLTADQIGVVTKTLKRLARELECPVMLLAQLNRSVDERTNKRPVLRDLRDSGAIEQDADVVMFLYRDEYYNKEKSDYPNQVEVITEKCREGETGSDYLSWEGQYQLMESKSTFDAPSATDDSGWYQGGNSGHGF